MPLEHPVEILAVTEVTDVITVGEMRGQLAQVALADRIAAPCTEGLRAGRPAIHQHELHVPPPTEKQNTVSVG
jgi:hypothetical protein